MIKKIESRKKIEGENIKGYQVRKTDVFKKFLKKASKGEGDYQIYLGDLISNFEETNQLYYGITGKKEKDSQIYYTFLTVKNEEKESKVIIFN